MLTRQHLLVAAVTVFFVSCADSGTSVTAPVISAASLQSEQGALKDEYVVLFKRGSGDTRGLARELATAGRGVLLGTFEGELAGFGVRIPAPAVERIRRNPNVLSVSPNLEYSAGHHATTQSAAAWGLDRIDQRNRPTNGLFSYDATGAGVRAYIVDTGIRSTHTEFGGRVLSGVSFVPDAYGTGDPTGHGTHVAGTVGGTTWGVAKLVSLVPVRVLDSLENGSTLMIVSGLSWIVSNHVKPAVVNMSLGYRNGPVVDPPMDAKINELIDAGVQVVVSAGNDANLGGGSSWEAPRGMVWVNSVGDCWGQVAVVRGKPRLAGSAMAG